MGREGGGGKGKERDWERRGGGEEKGRRGIGREEVGRKGKERDGERRGGRKREGKGLGEKGGGRKREGEGLGEKGGGKIQFQSKINKKQNKIKATTHKHMG